MSIKTIANLITKTTIELIEIPDANEIILSSLNEVFKVEYNFLVRIGYRTLAILFLFAPFTIYYYQFREFNLISLLAGVGLCLLILAILHNAKKKYWIQCII